MYPIFEDILLQTWMICSLSKGKPIQKWQVINNIFFAYLCPFIDTEFFRENQMPTAG